MKNKKYWIFKSVPKVKIKLAESEKIQIQSQCQPLVDEFKKQYVQINPVKQFTYLTDVYTKWYQNYLYFCDTRESVHPERIMNQVEEKFVRLEYTGEDRFVLSYFRHTGRWSLVATDMTLKDCMEMMKGNPNFQPIG